MTVNKYSLSMPPKLKSVLQWLGDGSESEQEKNIILMKITSSAKERWKFLQAQTKIFFLRPVLLVSVLQYLNCSCFLNQTKL